MKISILRGVSCLFYLILLIFIVKYCLRVGLSVNALSDKESVFYASLNGNKFTDELTSIDKAFRKSGYTLLDESFASVGVPAEEEMVITYDRAEIVIRNDTSTDCYADSCSVVKIDILPTELQKISICDHELFVTNNKESKVVYGFDWGTLKCFYDTKIYRIKINLRR